MPFGNKCLSLLHKSKMRMKNRFISLTFFLSLCLVSPAQDRLSADAYFASVLKGVEQTQIPSGRFGLAELEQQKKTVWQSWCRANLAFAEDKLPALRPLTNADTLRWHLPPVLEADSVMPFYFGTKGGRPADGWPLMLYLHGSGPKEHEFATGYILCQRFDDAPSLYFIPQIPSEKHYRWYLKGKQHIWEQLLRQSFASGEVDANRIYIFGISEGGYGSQRLASFYADYLAAAGPMAGGEVSENAPAENLGHVGFSFLTGADDLMFGRNRLTRRAAELLDSLQKRYPGEYCHNVQLIPGRGHHIDYNPTTPWLKSFVRTPRPLHFVWEDYPMDGRYRKGFYNIQVHERDTMGGNERTRYEMTVDGNVVNLSLERVKYVTVEREPKWGIPMVQHTNRERVTKGRFTLYLSPDMVDFGRKVTVVVNDRRVFKGYLESDVRHLAASCACFYDPERLFPAAVEVELDVTR